MKEWRARAGGSRTSPGAAAGSGFGQSGRRHPMNPDMVPADDFSPDFDYRRFVRLRLSDESPGGRLLGIHY